MRITRRRLRRIINEELQRVDEALEMMCPNPESLPEVIPLQKRELISRSCYAALWINAKTPHSNWFTQTFLKEMTPAAVRFLGGSEAAAAATSTLGAGLAAFVFVYGMFASLPTVLQASIDALGEIDGFLMNMRVQRDEAGFIGPLEYSHMSKERLPWIPKFGSDNVEWNRDTVVDFIAAGLGTAEGVALFNKLTSDEDWSLPWKLRGPIKKTYPGPIIGDSFSDRILRRRGEMIGDAIESMSEDISARVEELRQADQHEKVIEFAESLGWDGSQQI